MQQYSSLSTRIHPFQQNSQSPSEPVKPWLRRVKTKPGETLIHLCGLRGLKWLFILLHPFFFSFRMHLVFYKHDSTWTFLFIQAHRSNPYDWDIHSATATSQGWPSSTNRRHPAHPTSPHPTQKSQCTCRTQPANQWVFIYPPSSKIKHHVGVHIVTNSYMWLQSFMHALFFHFYFLPLMTLHSLHVSLADTHCSSIPTGSVSLSLQRAFKTSLMSPWHTLFFL